jgi:hypothetical protein
VHEEVDLGAAIAPEKEAPPGKPLAQLREDPRLPEDADERRAPEVLLGEEVQEERQEPRVAPIELRAIRTGGGWRERKAAESRSASSASLGRSRET